MLTRVTSTTECSNIGHPFGLNTIYILDNRLRLVPLGCVGELYIAGPQVARGYLNDPEQTAKAFVDNPFHHGSIMYATGDLARMSPVDRSITYLGRRDSQIKIRGLRVEAGEIESILKATTEIITNAAVLKVDIGHESLVAFLEYPSDTIESEELTIVLDDGLGPLLVALKNVVRRKLPSYMAPTNYVALNRFPLTSSGKLDRKALEAFFYLHESSIRNLESEETGYGIGYQDVSDPSNVPQTEVEAEIRSLWASVLRLNEGSLNMEDDFYASGGDSVSAIRLARAAREAGLQLPATDIIRNPTIRAMAKIAETTVLNHEFDDDDTPSMSLDLMAPHDLTLLDIDSAGLERLKEELFEKHGLSARFVVTT
jgi:aryl carrier-like protein